MARSRRRDDDDDDDDDDRPVKKSRSRRDDDDDDDDDDDEDERPTRKKNTRSRRDDDDDEDDDPRRRLKQKKAKKKGGSPAQLFIILGVVGGLLLLGGGVVVALVFLMETPERAFEDLKDAHLKKDYGRVYDRMDKETQQDFEKSAQLLIQFDKSLAVHNGKKGRELFVAFTAEMEKRGGVETKATDKFREEIKNTKVESVVVNGDTATLTIKGGNGRTETITMVKQDGTWRMKKKSGFQ